jgi:AraC-like DNA-binding protein
MAGETVGFIRVSDLFKHLKDFGYERKQLLEKSGLDDASMRIYERNGELPAMVFSRLYISAAALIPDELRQRYWAGGFSGRAFHLTAYAMISARNLQQALERAHDLHQMFDARQPRISVSSGTDTVRICYAAAGAASLERIGESGVDTRRVLAVAAAAGLVVWFSFLSWIIGQKIKLNRVVLGQDPDLNIDHTNSERLLHIDRMEYQPGDSFMEFPSRYLQAKIIITPESLERYLEYSPSEATPALDALGAVPDKILALLGRDFSNGFPSFNQLAHRMDLSTSTLRRKLMAEKSSYQIIKDEARRNLAIELLTKSDLPVSDIAARVGFMSQGSFSRFFHSRSGLTPQQYRRKHGNAPCTQKG